MTAIEKITEILKTYTKKHNISASSVILEEYAEELVANGVIVPPCKVGDKVYILYTKREIIEECEVIGIIIGRNNDTLQFKDGSIYTIWDKEYNEHFGKTVFLTKEQAEEKLRELKDNARDIV